MKVAGTADLAGTIRISLPDDFTPQEGERLTVLTATNITDRGVSLAGDAKGIQLLFGRTKVELLFGAESRK